MARVVRIRPRGYCLAAVLALVAAAAGNWWLNRTVRPEPEPPPEVDGRIDYALEDFTATFFDSQGQPSLRVTGPSLNHDAVTRRARLATPEFAIEPNTRGWTGRADRGVVDRDARRLVLEGSVRMQRPHERGAVTVTSERLEYDDRAATVHSPGPARVEQAGNELTGGTLTVWIDDQRLELTRDAQAIYRNADPAARR